MTKIPIGVQLYSVRHDCERDLPGVIKAVAAMGYAGVEFAGYYGRTAKELRTMLDDAGLKCCGTHTGFDTILGDELLKTIEFNQTLGNKYLIVPGLSSEHIGSKAAWLATAAKFNEASTRAREHGCYVGYHNHSVEFIPMDGELPWDIFFGNTSTDVVMQMDTGNMMHAGAHAAPFLESYPGRALTVHLKEYSPDDETALIGQGKVNWPEIFRLCEGIAGTEWYIVEYESSAFTPLECIDRCLQYLRSIGK
ncbi:MAG TPA: sugar phosphate isomerase/epimerase [Capsulimonadaceae bacterium]|jgi:sugar phosphate isomerase/epimerase